MPPQRNVLQCKANKMLVEKLQGEETMNMESQKDRLAMTFRRAIRSVRECPFPIRCKEDAIKLKGIGEYIASRIEYYLRKEDLLNVAPQSNELEAEVNPRPLKKTDICNYVPRSGGPAHLILLATVKCTCVEKSKSVSQDLVLKEINVISKTNILYRKFRDTLRILCSKGLIWQENDSMGLTDSGRKLGAILFEESRIDYPDIETCMQECLLDRLQELFGEVTSPTSASSKQGQSEDCPPQVSPSLPRLIWPLSLQPSNLRFGEYVEECEDDAPPLPDSSPIPGMEEEWEVVMLLDSREVRTLQDRSFLHNQLHQVGVMCEKRPLALGDMQWILRHASTNREIMLTTIVERKNTRDLAQSIIDGRFNEQQYRLLQCGCQHPVYLIEGDVRSQDVMSGESLQSGIVRTLVCRNLYVYMSTSIDDTVVFLKGLHDQVIASVHRFFESGDETCFHPQKLSFDDFQNSNAKTREVDYKHLWCRQLRQIPRCTVGKVEVIVSKYPTFASMLKAYDSLSTVQQKEELLKNLCDKNGKNQIGSALSRSIYHCLFG